MEKLYLYNTLTRKKEQFKPIKAKQVGIYTCGPTVYDYAHVGNLRTYIFEDILKRVLLYNKYKVKHVMNITDVGHLTGDMDMGEDKIEKGAKKEGKTAWQIADFYTAAFKQDMKQLNLLDPDIWCKATDNISEQINLIKKLEKKGYIYKISDGIYFNTAKFKDYTKLSHQNLEALQEGARVEKNKEKKNATDFALWKLSIPAGFRQQEWDSPWGVGFPGWHLECSAMSIKYLGDQFDIHCGGVDHINIHHTNEIAQSEAATSKSPWVKYWLHGEFLLLKEGRMGKSEGNIMTLNNLVEQGYDPVAYRFMTLMTHYRKRLNFTFKGLKAAEVGLSHLYNQVRELGTKKGKINQYYKDQFTTAINDDLNIPKALALIQEMLKSDLSNQDKLTVVLDFDKVLGLKLDRVNKKEELPNQITELVKNREKARKEKNYEQADKTREQIEKLGFIVEDTKDGMRVSRK